MTETCDILISGGGIAGLTAAAAFGAAGFNVICVDPAPPVTQRNAAGSDLRTTAILQPGRALLDRYGLWERLSHHATPLQIMRIIDAGGAEPEPRLIREFRAKELSDAPFGWNLPNWILRRELVSQLEELGNVDFRPGTATQSLLTRSTEARVGLSDGSRVAARLVIAADGRDSPTRQAAGIGVHTIRYGQKALALAVTHEVPHENVSTEIHRSGGPFTLVPLPDYEGEPSSALVWMERGPKISDLFAMSKSDFEAAMTERSCGLLGPLKQASRKTVWPIITQHAERFVGERLVLMAEAAHVVPPIGAQGLNMSLADLRALLEIAEARPGDLGDVQMLNAYERERKRDIGIRVKGIDILNRASMAQSRPLRDARALALETLYGLVPVRRMLMQMGLGVR